MPAFARWPGRIAPGSISMELVSTLDIFSTGLSLANVPVPEDRVIVRVLDTQLLRSLSMYVLTASFHCASDLQDGKNMLPVLFETGPSAHGALFHYRDDCPGHCANPNATHVSSGAHCVRTPFFKLLSNRLYAAARLSRL